MNINKLMKQAQAMQKQMQEAQAKIAELEVEGAAGGGMVKVAIKGDGNVQKVSLDPSIVDPEDVEMLEDLIVAALNDAKTKLEEESAGTMGDATAGMQMPPGFNLPF